MHISFSLSKALPVDRPNTLEKWFLLLRGQERGEGLLILSLGKRRMSPFYKVSLALGNWVVPTAPGRKKISIPTLNKTL